MACACSSWLSSVEAELRELRRIVWRMLFCIAHLHLHAHEIVHTDLKPNSSLIKGSGFWEGVYVYSFKDVCENADAADKRAAPAVRLRHTMLPCIAGFCGCEQGAI